MIGSFKEANTVLARYVPSARKFRAAYTLDTMLALMQALGDPQNSYHVIHVAGTSGKTSTAYYTAALLNQTGKRVGLTVSPHIDEINERVQIDLVPLAEADFCAELDIFLAIVNKLSIEPSYFELLVAFAFWEFARRKVDYAVIEVGLGGLLDGTNVISRPDKVCVLTDIGLDHTNVLGNTLSEIAAQKAGIMHPGNVAFSYVQSDEVMEVFRTCAQEQQTTLHEVTLAAQDKLPGGLPLFQQRNWWLAKQVTDFVLQRDQLPILSPSQLEKASAVYIPARMEIITHQQATIILDGAHNQQKMQTLVASLQNHYPGQKFAVLLALVRGKDLKVEAVLKEILPITSHLILTSFTTQQDLRKYATDPSVVLQKCRELAFDAVEVITSPTRAYHALLERPEKVKLVTGSFYLLNHVRPLVKELAS
jgi:dihydrofolate synthase/folylpolyglutamate synthase